MRPLAAAEVGGCRRGGVVLLLLSLLGEVGAGAKLEDAHHTALANGNDVIDDGTRVLGVARKGMFFDDKMPPPGRTPSPGDGRQSPARACRGRDDGREADEQGQHGPSPSTRGARCQALQAPALLRAAQGALRARRALRHVRVPARRRAPRCRRRAAAHTRRADAASRSTTSRRSGSSPLAALIKPRPPSTAEPPTLLKRASALLPRTRTARRSGRASTRRAREGAQGDRGARRHAADRFADARHLRSEDTETPGRRLRRRRPGGDGDDDDGGGGGGGAGAPGLAPNWPSCSAVRTRSASVSCQR